MNTEPMKDAVYEMIRQLKQELKRLTERADAWENKKHEYYNEVNRLEDLYEATPNEHIGISLDKAYHRLEKYDSVCNYIDEKIYEIEQALYGLEKAEYWL